MEGGPVVLLGQGEQYAEPDDWAELIRTRRIRRGVEVLVRRYGLTSLRPPEDVPELAALLDQIDPTGPPSQAVPLLQKRPAAPASASSVPLSAGSGAPAHAGAPGTSPGAAAPAGALPTAAPRKRWRFGVWRWVFALGALLLVRLCARDGFGSLPTFGARSDEGREYAADAGRHGAAACAGVRGWIARAACGDPAFARLRPVLAQAYTARAARLDPDDRAALADEQQRWAAGRGACRTDPAPGSCLAKRYKARIAELQEPVAQSDPPAGAGRYAAARAASPVAPLLAVDRPDWVRRPDRDEVADAYPERASRLDIDGRALLSCRATASGALTACDIVSEDPPDYGFGGAALRLSRFYQIRPRTPDGRPVDGAKVDLPVAFKGG